MEKCIQSTLVDETSQQLAAAPIQAALPLEREHSPLRRSIQKYLAIYGGVLQPVAAPRTGPQQDDL